MLNTTTTAPVKCLPEETLAQRLIKLRSERGLSQENLAYEINVSRDAYGKYERAVHEPNIAVIKELASFYGVSTDYLLLGKHADSNQAVCELLEKYPPAKQRKIIRILLDLLSESEA